jgi:hypothetical protein
VRAVDDLGGTTVDDSLLPNTIVILRLYAEHDPDQLPRVLWVGLGPSGIIQFVEYFPDGTPDWVARWMKVAGPPGPIELQITESEYHRWLEWRPEPLAISLATELERLADDEAAGRVAPPRYHRARRKG